MKIPKAKETENMLTLYCVNHAFNLQSDPSPTLFNRSLAHQCGNGLIRCVPFPLFAPKLIAIAFEFPRDPSHPRSFLKQLVVSLYVKNCTNEIPKSPLVTQR